jgi:hypothetical protein
MQFIFNANTPEELRQEIVQFLARMAEQTRSLKNITDSKRAHLDIESVADGFETAKDAIASAKIEPKPTPEQQLCKNCQQPIRRATEVELMRLWGEGYSEGEEDWIHAIGAFTSWTCPIPGQNALVAEPQPQEVKE